MNEVILYYKHMVNSHMKWKEIPDRVVVETDPDMRCERYSQHMLRELREDLGLTQDQLAKGSGVSKITITNLERGEAKNPGIEILAKITRYFSQCAGYKISFWIDDPEDPQEEQEAVAG
jgi:DNA-binding XRE family transcriptional regulator